MSVLLTTEVLALCGRIDIEGQITLEELVRLIGITDVEVAEFFWVASKQARDKKIRLSGIAIEFLSWSAEPATMVEALCLGQLKLAEFWEVMMFAGSNLSRFTQVLKGTPIIVARDMREPFAIFRLEPNGRISLTEIDQLDRLPKEPMVYAGTRFA